MIAGIYCFIILSFNSGIFGQGYWESTNTPTTQFLRSVCFVDSLYGWATGDSGVILHTNDGGENWEIQQSTTTYEISDIFFLNRDLGWASAYNYLSPPFGTVLLKTTNGGATWNGEQYQQENTFISTILFLDSLNGWMGALPHAILHTTDGGFNWQKAEVDTSTLAFFPVINIRFLNDQIGYACGGMHDIAGVIWQTTNGGEKWYAIDPMFAPADEIYGLHIFDDQNVLATGGDPDFTYGVSMLRTSDGGLSWDYNEPGIQGSAYGLEFRTATEAWCPLGPVQKFIYSLDSGNTWTAMDTPESAVIFDISFPDTLHGFAVGMNGAILKYIAPGTVSLSENKNSNVSFILNQNNPNPCYSSTNIEFSIPSDNPGYFVFEVINSFGEQLKFLSVENLDSGNRNIELNTSNWPSGLYLYQLRSFSANGQFLQSESKRMIVLH